MIARLRRAGRLPFKGSDGKNSPERIALTASTQAQPARARALFRSKAGWRPGRRWKQKLSRCLQELDLKRQQPSGFCPHRSFES
jgi:hypothetical protein